MGFLPWKYAAVAMYYPCIYPIPSVYGVFTYIWLICIPYIMRRISMGIYTHIVCVRLLFSNSSSWSTTVRCDDKKSCLSLGGMWYIPKIAPENTRVIKLRILGVLNNTFPETSSLPLKIDHPKRKFIFQPSILRCYICYFQGG